MRHFCQLFCCCSLFCRSIHIVSYSVNVLHMVVLVKQSSTCIIKGVIMLCLKQSNAGCSQDFRMLWSQLQQGQKQAKPVAAQPVTVRDKPRPAIRPPFPHVNGHLLSLPPQAWLKQDAAASSSSSTVESKSERSSAQNLAQHSNPATSEKPKKVGV